MFRAHVVIIRRSELGLMIINTIIQSSKQSPKIPQMKKHTINNKTALVKKKYTYKLQTLDGYK